MPSSFTEPEAGSDAAGVRTKATKGEDLYTAMDRLALAAANSLVGNANFAAAIEISGDPHRCASSHQR